MAPTGYIHAYDLSRLFIAASLQITLGDNSLENRIRLKNSLENLHLPVDGLVKSYSSQFSSYDISKPFAHEALSDKYYCMAQFDDDDRIVVRN